MTKQVKAPVGFHFMIKDSTDFYLMRNAPTGYVKHEAGDYSSSLTLEVELKGSHAASSTRTTVSRSTSSAGTTVTRTSTPTRSTTVTYTSPSSGGSSGGGGY